MRIERKTHKRAIIGQFRGILVPIACALSVQANAQDSSDRAEIIQQRDAPYCTLAYAKSLVGVQPTEKFVDIAADDVSRRLTSQMYNYLAFSLQKAAHPTPVQGPSRLNSIRVYAAYGNREDDLIEYVWDQNGRSLRAVAGLNAIKLELKLSEFAECAETRGTICVNAVREFVSVILRTEGEDTRKVHFELEVPWDDNLNDGRWLSTNPNKSINRIGYWHERVDLVVEDGILSIFVYKKIAQLLFYQDGSKWFDDEFRALVHRKAAEQGIAPPNAKGE